MAQINESEPKSQVIIVGGHPNYQQAVADSLHDAGLDALSAENEHGALELIRSQQADPQQGSIVGLVALAPFHRLYPGIPAGEPASERVVAAPSGVGNSELPSERERVRDGLTWHNALTPGFVVASLHFGLQADSDIAGRTSWITFNGLDVPQLGAMILNLVRGHQTDTVEGSSAS